MTTVFTINGKPMFATLQRDNFMVNSTPYPYKVSFVDTIEEIQLEIVKEKHPVILIDATVAELYPSFCLTNLPIRTVICTENEKQIDTVLSIVDFFQAYSIDKGSKIFVIGGGILQDLGAFACAIYKRGIPWAFIPTTLLSQTDSCVGGKTALNYKGIKNTLALFSAPRQVWICKQFLSTLQREEMCSGMGEAFRLAITGGRDSFNQYKSETKCNALIQNALSIKQTIVEMDEFETNIRRVMNYGHSIGHALESLLGYQIPHGIAITLGILIENEYSYLSGLLSYDENKEIFNIGKKIIPDKYKNLVLPVSDLMSYMINDKKVVNNILKMPTLIEIGNMEILDFNFENTYKMQLAVCTVMDNLK